MIGEIQLHQTNPTVQGKMKQNPVKKCKISRLRYCLLVDVKMVNLLSTNGKKAQIAAKFLSP